MAIGLTRQVNGRFGALVVGLDATPTGSDASADVVADFTGATTTQFADQSSTTPIAVTHSQTLGSTFKIAVRGIWEVKAEVPVATAASVLAALNLDGVAGDLNTDPVALSPRNRAFARWVGTAAGEADTKTLTANILVTQTMADDAAQAVVRLLLSNAAGVGATAASLAVLANARLSFTWLADVPPGS